MSLLQCLALLISNWLLFFSLTSSIVWAAPLAVYGDKMLSQRDFYSLLKVLGVQNFQKDSLQKQKLLEDVVEVLAVTDYARKHDFRVSRDMKKQLDFISAKFLARAFLDQELKKRLTSKQFSEEDLRLYYKTHIEKFKQPAHIRAKILSLRVKNLEKIQQLATIKKALQKGELCFKLENVTNVFWISDTGMRPISSYKSFLRKALLKAPLKKWVGPVTNGNNVYFLEVLERQPEEIIPFEKVREKVLELLRAETKKALLEQIISEILAKEKVKIYIENLQ